MAKDYKNPLEARVTKPEPIAATAQPQSEIPDWLPKEALEADYSNDILDANQELEMPEYMFEWKGVGFFPIGSINSITGHKKNGKTMFETLLMVACLKAGEPIGPLRYALAESRPEPKVLFIDTEQEQAYSLMVQRRVHHLMGWDYKENVERFKILWLHDELDAKVRYNKMCKMIWDYRPDFIVLDGSRDMVRDINDADESTTFVRNTMNIATKIKGVLAQALHYNPGTEKMRGWLGTELGNRVAYIIELAKEIKGEIVTFLAHFTDCRGKDVQDVKFYVDDNNVKFGIPRLLELDEVMKTLSDQADAKSKEELKSMFAFMGARTYTYWTIAKKIREANHFGEDKAAKAITDSVKFDILADCGDNKFKLKLTNDAEQASMSLDESNDDPF